MNVLLDTHSFLWFVWGDPQLSAVARRAIEDPANEIWVSPATYWEVANKMSVRKLALNLPHDVFFETHLAINGFRILSIQPRHSAALVSLPYHHRDPFDRMIVAQAIVENMDIISVDPILDKYPIRRIW